jgi:hydroxymethylbilane synthase
MPKKQITIATRESPLALWQANWVRQQLQQFHPHLSVNLLGLTTQGDRFLETSLSQIGGKGLFVKELEEAILDGRADLAVHSMKDVPMTLPEGLVISVMCERSDPRDVFVSHEFKNVKDLPAYALLGTSSLRRQSQLRSLYPHLKIENIRGNVNTRIARLDKKEFAGLILAAAGLKRLGMEDKISSYLSFEESLPAPGQGVLGLESRIDDVELQDLISVLNHEETQRCVTAERAMCVKLGGGCQVPIAAFAKSQGKNLELKGLVGSVDGKIILTVSKVGENPEELGLKVAEDLLSQGAGDILNAL